jgi:hypothetical protein
MDATQPPSSDELRFDKADVAAGAGSLACLACQRPLHDVYFEINGQPACERCRYEVESDQSRGSGVGRFARALVGGGFGALVGSGIYYAVLALTGFEVGLVAIVVGFLVGAGVRWGSGGRGGWAYQGLAVALTYVAIVSTYVPLVFEELGNMDTTEVAEGQALGTTAAAVPAATVEGSSTGTAPSGATLDGETAEATPAEEVPDLTAGQAVVALALFSLLMLALPFLGGFENIVGLFIIGIGLFQAWAMNRRQPLLIEGPFQVGKSPPPTPVEPAAT